MKFMAVLNREIKSGLAVNALAQMALGLGHRFTEGFPDVDIYWGSADEVRAFRTQVAGSRVIYSDFPHTMEGGDTTSLIDTIENTPEEKITYYGACLVAEEITTEVVGLLSNLSQLKNYQPYVNTKKAVIGPVGETTPVPTREEDTKKTTTLVNAKKPLATTINDIVLANIEAGRTIPYDQLHLLRIGRMQGVSFNTHPIVKADTPAKHTIMTSQAKTNKLVVIDRKDNTTPLVSVVFGERDEVEKVVTKKLTRMFDPAIELEALKTTNSTSLVALSFLGDKKEVVQGDNLHHEEEKKISSMGV